MRRRTNVAGTGLLAIALLLPAAASGERGRGPGFVYTSRESIEEAQDVLVALGCLEPAGHTKGEWDTPTRRAAQRFQREHFLRPDGRLDRDTMALLMSHRPRPGGDEADSRAR